MTDSPVDDEEPGGQVPEDCTSCGACCHSARADWIEVFAVDERRMGPASLALSHELGSRRFMRFERGRCAALEERAGRWLCRIYEERPDACRWLERGSGTCSELIELHRLRRSGG